jgi:hypothetical protein
MLRLAGLASLALVIPACGGSPRPSTPAAPAGPVRPIPEPEEGAAPAALIDRIASGDQVVPICFGWSPRGNVLCDVGSSSIQGGATMAIRVLGPDADEHVYYQHPDDEQFFDVDPARIDRAALTAAREAALAGGFQGWNGPMIDLDENDSAEVGGWSLRRVRTQTGEDGDPMTGVWETWEERVELRCGDRWVPVPLEGDIFANTIEPATISLARLGDMLVATAMVSWGIEGDSGGGTDAAMLDVGALCPALAAGASR